MKTLKYTLIALCALGLTNCVQESHPKDINVKLDMTSVENPTKVGIRGQFPLSWDETTYLEDTNGDGIFEGTFNIYTANKEIEFKFVNQDNQFELQDQNNRVLEFEYHPEKILVEATFENPETKIIKNK